MPSLPTNSTDFQTVVVKRRPATTSKSSGGGQSLSSSAQLLATKPRGGKRLVATEHSHNRSAHSHQTGVGAKLHRLDTSSASTKHVKVSPEFARAMQKARLERKWTQKQLAQQIHEKPQVIHQYESGKAIPNGAIMQKLNKVLGGNLPAARRRQRKAGK